MKYSTQCVVVKSATPVAREKPEVIEMRSNCCVKSKWAVELLQREKDYLEYHELKLPTKDVVGRDPRQYPNGAMWRDTIRFALLWVDLRTMVVDDETELCAFSFS